MKTPNESGNVSDLIDILKINVGEMFASFQNPYKMDKSDTDVENVKLLEHMSHCSMI